MRPTPVSDAETPVAALFWSLPTSHQVAVVVGVALAVAVVAAWWSRRRASKGGGAK